MSGTIRLLRPSDRATLRRWVPACFEPLGDYGDLLDGWLRDGRAVTVVASDGGPVGFATVARRRGSAYLLGVAVRPDHRGRKLGRSLVEEAIDQARRRARFWGVAALHLHVAEDNGPARRLFVQLGFEEVGPGPAFADGSPSREMQRALDAVAEGLGASEPRPPAQPADRLRRC